ncbi:MAG: DNA-3-methyladenine glycosylase [Patescibacteria group bacterium]
MEESLKVLKKHAIFGPLVKRHGPPDLKRGKNAFQALCRSIVYQQVTGKAAATIFARFRALFPGKAFPTPEMVQAASVETLRGAGLSGQKATYIKDLADKFCDGTIQHRTLHKLSSDEVIAHVTQVKGIGVWTAHMFLIFTLNRPDVLPVGDLGVQKGFRRVFKLRKLPTPAHMERLAKDWRSHASVASWYLWREADAEKLE